MNPADRKYTREHGWAKLESENEVLIGITDYAQEGLGDVVYLSLSRNPTTSRLNS